MFRSLKKGSVYQYFSLDDNKLTRIARVEKEVKVLKRGHEIVAAAQSHASATAQWPVYSSMALPSTYPMFPEQPYSEPPTVESTTDNTMTQDDEGHGGTEHTDSNTEHTDSRLEEPDAPFVSNETSIEHIDPQRYQELMSYLTPPVMKGLFEVWFRDYQAWCPIFDRPTIEASLPEPEMSSMRALDDVHTPYKAIFALTVRHSTPAITLGYDGRRELFTVLRSEVLKEVEAEPTVSCTNLQALLVIAILDYGNGLILDFQDRIRSCQRYVKVLSMGKKEGRPTS